MMRNHRSFAFAALMGLACLPTAIAQTAPSAAKESRVVGLAGTVWAGTDSDGDHYEFTFKPGGVLHYTSPSGGWTDAHWTQKGDRVFFAMNNKFSEYEGRITDDRMDGSAKNIKGKRWTWSVTRKPRAAQRPVTRRPAI